MQVEDIKEYKNCPYCGKENYVAGDSANAGFCNKIHEANYKSDRQRYGQDRYKETL